MGCSFSAAAGEGTDESTLTFRVYNVDRDGMELNPGKIQVAANDLILYQKGKERICWPLRCLRRYGFDAELFSFESGRRCPTGPGIYAFKCRHAEALFNLVQENIQRAGQEDQLRASSGSGGGSSSGTHGIFTRRSRPASFTDRPEQYGTILMSSSKQLAVVNSDSQQQLYVNGTITPDNAHLYVNTGKTVVQAFQIDESAPLIDFMNRPGHRGGPGVRSQVNYAELDLPSSMENLLDETGQGAVHNFPRNIQTSASHANAAAVLNRLSMPADLSGALGPDDLLLQPADSDVFLSDMEGSACCPTYINVNVDEPSPPLHRSSESSAAGSVGTGGNPSASSYGLSVDPLTLVPNYANLVLHGANGGPPPYGSLQPRLQKGSGVNYIQLDLNQVPSSDAVGTGCGLTTSPTSPTSMASLSVPESPGYAMIDFNKTEALSNSTRGGTDGVDDPGARKTRHNSTIGV